MPRGEKPQTTDNTYTVTCIIKLSTERRYAPRATQEKSMKRAAMVLVAVFFAAGAQAGVEVRFAVAFASPETPVHYVYRLRLVSGSLEPGATISQHATLYDIPSLVEDSLTCPAGWTGSVQARGTDADDIPLSGKQDSPRMLNVTCRWNGTEPVEAPAELGTMGFDVGVIGGGVMSGGRIFSGQSWTFFGARGLIGRITGPTAITP
jgi:hypothetical protein